METTNQPLPADFEFAALESASNYRAALLAEFAPYLKGHVLEVGAGIGHISQEILKADGLQSFTAVEPGPHLAAQFRRRLPQVELVEGTVEDFGVHDVDAIVTANVLEHIRDDDGELARYRALLRARRGHLCLFVPARPEIYAPIDRDFGHHRRYERRGLRKKLEAAGFEVLRIDYFNIVGYVAWWLNFRILKKRAFDPGSVRLFDTLIFPAVHALESRVMRPPIGQSLIAVCRATL